MEDKKEFKPLTLEDLNLTEEEMALMIEGARMMHPELCPDNDKEEDEELFFGEEEDK